MNFLPDDYSIPQDDLGIRTHSRYVVNVFKLIGSKRLTFKLTRSEKYASLLNEEKILKKLEIVKYTVDSIKTEHLFSQQDNEFLPLALSWLWIKGYYSLFHLLSLLISLEKNDSRYMLERKYNDHSKIISIGNEILTSHKPFNFLELNNSFTGSVLYAHKTQDHVNLKNVDSFNLDLYKLSLKKAYSEEKKAKLKGLRGKKRDTLQAKIDSKCFTIFDLFLYYREKFNYSGFQYLDSGDQINNFSELSKFNLCSYEIVISLSSSIVEYLCENTTGKVNEKLNEIRAILSR